MPILKFLIYIVILYRHPIRSKHQYPPIHIEWQYPSYKLEINRENEDMNKIPFVRYLVGILKETINPRNAKFINYKSQGHITYQGRNIII